MNAITANAESQRRIFKHFAERLEERFGGGLDALPLWRALAHALHAQDQTLLRLVARVNRKGRRVFVCRLADGRFLFVLFDCEIGLPITVFCEGMVIRCEGKGTIRLGVPDGFR
jgi:hypothetical protein